MMKRLGEGKNGGREAWNKGPGKRAYRVVLAGLCRADAGVQRASVIEWIDQRHMGRPLSGRAGSCRHGQREHHHVPDVFHRVRIRHGIDRGDRPGGGSGRYGCRSPVLRVSDGLLHHIGHRCRCGRMGCIARNVAPAGNACRSIWHGADLSARDFHCDARNVDQRDDDDGIAGSWGRAHSFDFHVRQRRDRSGAEPGIHHWAGADSGDGHRRIGGGHGGGRHRQPAWPDLLCLCQGPAAAFAGEGAALPDPRSRPAAYPAGQRVADGASDDRHVGGRPDDHRSG